MHGKRGRDGSPLLASYGELDSDAIVAGLARHLEPLGVPAMIRPAAERKRVLLPLAPRTPYFCSGCPHNSSTKVAPGTLVGGGIGCHAMVLLMPEAQVGSVTGLSQMGGEGAQWIGLAPFVAHKHFVQNIGDGTFTHSGSLAIRAAVAAGVNITFKLLRNSAVAMTGGQQAMGELPVDRLLALLAAEGVRKVVVTTDDPARLRRQLGRRADVRHRDDLLDVQRELAAVEGVTVLMHDQECAAEKRRKRRRGKAQAPAQRVFINERVCEGCGDCGAKSNCLSVQPVATEFGRKTAIDQSSCNLDFSCLAGDCPSFLSVTPAAARPPTGQRGPSELVQPPPEPAMSFDADGFALRITGVGGTGVVTIAQILATAAAAEGRYVRTLDQTGLAQKGGAVVSDLKIGTDPFEHAAKLADGECDLYLGCDSLVATDGGNLRVADARRTIAVVSTTEVPTGQMVVNTAARFPAQGQVMSAAEGSVRSARFLDAASAGPGAVRRRAVREHDPGRRRLPGRGAAHRRRGDRARHPAERGGGGGEHRRVPPRPAVGQRPGDGTGAGPAGPAERATARAVAGGAAGGVRARAGGLPGRGLRGCVRGLRRERAPPRGGGHRRRPAGPDGGREPVQARRLQGRVRGRPAVARSRPRPSGSSGSSAPARATPTGCTRRCCGRWACSARSASGPGSGPPSPPW